MIKTLSTLKHQVVIAMKRLLYGRRGEPYRIAGHTLHYLPGTRPVRLRYLRSPNPVVRYDALQVQLLSTSLAEGDTAIDVGAHHGVYSILMAAMCGQAGRVVAFEPDPVSRGILVRNLDLNPDVKRPIVEAAACYDTTGEAVLYGRGGNSLSSLAPPAVERSTETPANGFRVRIVTLDGWLSEQRMAAPRWVKIDAEGAEIRILTGARRLLESDSGIICELHPYAWPEFGSTLSELKSLAASSGRRIRYLGTEGDIGDSAEYGTVLLERL